MAAKTSQSKQRAIRPLGDRVMIKLIEAKHEAKTASGIIIPGKEKEERHERGTIIATGPGRLSGDGKRVPMDVKLGDVVWFKRGYDAEEVEIDGEDHVLTSEGSILAVEG